MKNRLIKAFGVLLLACLVFVASVSATPVEVGQYEVIGCCTQEEATICHFFELHSYDFLFVLHYDGTVVFFDGTVVNVEDLEETDCLQCPVYHWRTVFNSGLQIPILPNFEICLESEAAMLADGFYAEPVPMSTCPQRPGGGPCHTHGLVTLRHVPLGPNGTYCLVSRRYWGTRCRYCSHEIFVGEPEMLGGALHNITQTRNQLLIHSARHPGMCRVRLTYTDRCSRCIWIVSSTSTYTYFFCSDPNFWPSSGVLKFQQPL